MRVALAAAAVILGAVAVGCAGDDSGGETQRRTVTVTTTAQPSPPASDQGEGSDPAAELRAYFETVEKQLRRYDETRERVLAAIDDLNESEADETWVRAARKLEGAADEYDRLAVDLGVVEPPPALRREHRALTRSLLLFAQFVERLQAALAAKSPTDLLEAGTAGGGPSRVNELRAEWRLGASVLARRLGVEMPKRLTRVGRSS